MLILIDLAAAGVTLRDPGEFTRFSVALDGGGEGDGEGDGDLADVVARTGLGRVAADGDHVVVDPAAVRALAGPAADAAWEEGFAGMCAYAASKGWVEADGGLLAHVEGRGEPG